MHLISTPQVYISTSTESMKKNLVEGEPSQLLVNSSGDINGSHQIDSIDNVLPSCDFFSNKTLIPRRIFTTRSENRMLEQVNLFESLIHCKNGKSSYKSQHSYPYLILDIGEQYTRAIAFGVVEDSYHLIAIGESISTNNEPFNDIWMGVNNAVKHLTRITGYDFSHEFMSQHAEQSRKLSTNNSVPILITGSDINVVILQKSSTFKEKTLRNLLSTTPCNIIFEEPIENSESFIRCLNEILIRPPDLLICEKSLELEEHFEMSSTDLVNIYSTAFPSNQIPTIFFYQKKPGTGVTELNIKSDLVAERDKEFLRTSRSGFSDHEKSCVAEIINNIRTSKRFSLNQTKNFDGHPTVHRLESASRVIQFLDKARTGTGGILSVNMGYMNASMTSSLFGDVYVNNYPEFGMRSGIQQILNNTSQDFDLPWLAGEIDKSYIEEYLSNKSIYPFSIPVTEMDLEIEYAIQSQILFSLINKYETDRELFNKESSRNKSPYELIISSGYLFSHSQDFVKDALVLLNGIQPIGVVSMLLDQMDLVPALGAAAEIEPLIPVDVIESGVFTNLGTFICAESQTKTGTILLKVKINYESGKSEDYVINKGDLVNFSVSEQEYAELVIQPLHKCDIGMGPGKGGKIRVKGGRLGIVIDARGRPVPLPANKRVRVEKIRQWESSLRRFYQ